MTKSSKAVHDPLRVAHEHTQSAAEIIHELLAGPDEVDQVHLEAAIELLRKALVLMDPYKL
jgi:hypothetical protein